MAKLLTEAGWKAAAQKYKIKDNGLQKALADYEKLPLDGAPQIGNAKFIEVSEKRSKALKEVQRLVGLLLKAKEVAANKDVTKYLKDVDAACHSEDVAISKGVAEAKEHEKKGAADAAAKAAAQAHPDPKMLSAVFNLGWEDGMNGRSSRSNLFAKAPPFQKQYNEGFSGGSMAADSLRRKGPQPQGPSMGPITKEQEERDKQYTRDRARRKEFIQYLNEQWGTVLPEDM